MRFLATSAALTLPLALGALAPAVSAQSPTRTIPTGLLTREGNARHWIPGHFAPAHAQTTYHADAVNLPDRNLDRLWLRPDGGTSTAMAAHRYVVTLDLSSRGVPTPDQVWGQSYDVNRGNDVTRVLDHVPVDFPAHQNGGSGQVQGWAVSLPFQPFPYRSGNSLQLEWRIEVPSGSGSSASSDAWFVDAEVYQQSSTYGYFARDNERRACPDRNTAHGGDCGGPGQLASVWWYSGGPAGAPAVTWFGTSDQSYQGISLPLPLDNLGLPGCSIYTAPEVMLSGVTDLPGSGRFRVDVPIPPDPNLARQEIYTQTAVHDAGVPGGLRLSDRGRFVIGRVPQRPLQAIHLYSYNPPLNDTPEYVSGYAPVLGLR